MRIGRSAVILGIGSLVLLGIWTVVQAQVAKSAKAPVIPPPPTLITLGPPGVTCGQSAEWTLTGKGLQQVDRIEVTGDGLAFGEFVKQTDDTLTVRVQAAETAAIGLRDVRVGGPGGLSNLLLVRVDDLPQSVETEPNDEPAQATKLALDSAVAGVLKPLDLDYYRIPVRGGTPLTFEVEARRLGLPISPVVTLFTAEGAALAQGREVPGLSRDCRLQFVPPSDGELIVEVRDNTYSGAENAWYRLRVEERPTATAVFPLGGPKGQTITVTASGGTLAQPRSKTISLPATAGDTLDVGPFDGPRGAVTPPQRLVVGDGPEVTESADGQPTPLPRGATANGRLDQSDEVDRYLIPVKKGEAFRLRIVASDLGSWLDSVLSLRDEKGNELRESDDSPINRGNALLARTNPDSFLEYEPTADGTLTAEIFDRAGEGGPEYAYRLEHTAAEPEFLLNLNLGGIPQGNNPQVARKAQINRPAGASGVFHLAPGSQLPLNFQVVFLGPYEGSVEVRAEGLPPGLTVAPVTLKPTRRPKLNQPTVETGTLVLKADKTAAPGPGTMRVLAVGTMKDGRTFTRHPVPNVAIESISIPSGRPQPVSRNIETIHVVVPGYPRRPFVGPVRPVRLAKLTAPTTILIGSEARFDVPLVNPDAVPGSRSGIVAMIGGPEPEEGLEARILEEPVSGDETAERVKVAVTAAVFLKPGKRTLVLTTPDGSKEQAEVELKLPVSLQPPTKPIEIKVGGSALLQVGVKREPGYDRPFRVEFSDLPAGIAPVAPVTVTGAGKAVIVKLERAADAPKLPDGATVKVVAVAPSDRGPVRIEAANSPILAAPRSEKERE